MFVLHWVPPGTAMVDEMAGLTTELCRSGWISVALRMIYQVDRRFTAQNPHDM
jgi:hypothetical protein